MRELRPRDVGVITCVGDPSAMDALDSLPGVMSCRVAPDETMLLSPPEHASAVTDEATARVMAADPDAIVMDATDGWAAWTLRGEDLDAAFGRLSAVPPAPGFSQGDVAHVPVKIVSSEGTLDLLVPAMWGAYLHEQIMGRCAGVIDRSESVAWTAHDGAAT